MRKLVAILVIVSCAGLAGCCWFRSKPKLFPVDVCLHTSRQLQWYEGRPHTLYVRVFPLTAADAFATAEVADLLADPPPALPGAAGPPQSRMLYPDSTTTLTFDAVDGRAFSQLGIVAGYYKPEGRGKQVVGATKLRTGSCYTFEFGPAGIEGGGPAAERTKTPDLGVKNK